jgi:hypothetical protein
MIMDLNANALDGEFGGVFSSGNFVAGGNFVTEFTIATPVVMGPTLPRRSRQSCSDRPARLGAAIREVAPGLPGVLDLSSEQASFTIS